jgi:hypothetical protein
VIIQGIAPGQLYSGEAIRGLFDAINAHVKDGGKLILE